MLFNPFRVAQTPRARTINLIKLERDTPIHSVDPCYLSYSIDISLIIGGQWWEGSTTSSRGLGTNRVPPLAFNPPKLSQFVQHLSPAYLRVGGSEADTIHYFCADQAPHDKEPELSEAIWNRLLDFIAQHDLKFMFTFKYGAFNRSQHGNWNGADSAALLQYTLKRGSKIDVCELGNELNAYWAFHGLKAQPRTKQLVLDYQRFINQVRLLSPDSLIAGPGSAFWPYLGETIKYLSNITPGFLAQLEGQLDIVDWHYYPFQSQRSPVRTRTARIEKLLDPRSLQDFETFSNKLESYRAKYQPQAQLWTGESGSAQCGGQPKLSDRFASCFWWADQLGRGAKLGQKVMIRQSLIGGDYGLIQRETLKPNPDFWVSWLWKRLMGCQVYDVSCANSDLIVYCHGGHKQQRMTLLIINMTPRAHRVRFQAFGTPKRRFEITADKLTSKKVLINGVIPKFRKGKVRLKDFPKLAKIDLVAPYSINFWTFSEPEDDESSPLGHFGEDVL
ncbi:glycoside hydrolase [Marinomonas ostreistagni]|uniref:glycoside hydrolase n=1 Tax=Marinomonas ostreistagni TaxID=359209 RepID=UPI0019516DC3|nr:glycoside hydrolase [Marinomonas ostreistagni]MBM6551796.1 glycoside hydrolase [Marinomonas ostreistagni]